MDLLCKVYIVSNENFKLLGEDSDILNEMGTLAELPDFQFSGRRWKRVVDIGAAKMDSVNIKLGGRTVSVSFQQNMDIIDASGREREITSTSNNTFDLPPNVRSPFQLFTFFQTLSSSVKASLGPGKVTVTGEVSAFKSEVTFNTMPR